MLPTRLLQDPDSFAVGACKSVGEHPAHTPVRVSARAVAGDLLLYFNQARALRSRASADLHRLIQNMRLKPQRGRHPTQRLKPCFRSARYGTSELVPFPRQTSRVVAAHFSALLERFGLGRASASTRRSYAVCLCLLCWQHVTSYGRGIRHDFRFGSRRDS
jgi:hypothetical protein